MNGRALLSALRTWVVDHASVLTQEGVAVRLDESRESWAKASLSLDFEGPERLAQLTIWATGETEIGRADVPSGVIQTMHYDFRSASDLKRSLDHLLRWVCGRET